MTFRMKSPEDICLERWKLQNNISKFLGKVRAKMSVRVNLSSNHKSVILWGYKTVSISMAEKQKSHHALKFCSHIYAFFSSLFFLPNEIIFSICHSSFPIDHAETFSAHHTQLCERPIRRLWYIKVFVAKTNNKVIEKTIKKPKLIRMHIKSEWKIQRKCQIDKNENAEKKYLVLLRANRKTKRWIRRKMCAREEGKSNVYINQLSIFSSEGSSRRESQTIYVKSLSNFRFGAHRPAVYVQFNQKTTTEWTNWKDCVHAKHIR